MYKHANKPWLAGFTKDTFQKLADYLLGDKVMKLPAARDTNRSIPWRVILAYELAIRRKAMDYVKDDKIPLAEALEKAMKDSETRALHFTDRISLGTKRPREDTHPDEDTWPTREPGGRGQGDEGDKGGKGRRAAAKAKAAAADFLILGL